MASANSLAARCTACGTVFRVVPDQLRVSEGWVRCGRCSEVFNASLNLVDIETGAPVGGAEDTPASQAHVAQNRDPLVLPGRRDQDAPDAPDKPHDAAPPSPGERAQTIPEPDFEIHIDSDPAHPGDATQTPLAEGDALPDPRAEPDDRPSFVRRAERQARWRSPRMRATLAVAALFAVLLLLVQVLVEYRDLAAARWPLLRPPLEQACAWMGCKVGTARDIQGLTVEASGLLRVEKSALYRFNVTLRNRTGIELALPSLDLTLNDSQGRLVARRVLHPGDLGAAQEALAAGAELALQATLQARLPGNGTGEGVAGYTIEVFYP